MSTNINSGIKFASGDFHEVWANIQTFRTALVPLTEQGIGSYIAARLTRMVDEAAAAGEPLGENFLSKAVGEFRDDVDEIKKTSRRNPGVDFEFKVMILPHKGDLYGMTFTEQPEWRKAFVKHMGASDFSFHDSTDDLPVGVSRKAYAARGRLWNEIIPDMVPIKNGVEADLTMTVYWPEWAWIEPCFADFEARVAEVAENRASFAKMRELAGGEDDSDKYFSAFWEARRWLKTDEGKAAIAVHADLARPLLPPVLSRTVLDGTAFDVPK